MNEQEALAKMKTPKDRRNGIWRNGVLQIMVTRACDKSCFGCTQGSNLGGKPVMMTPEQFEEACISLKGYFGVVGMFGGNPAIHPQFDVLCEIMRKHIPAKQRGLWCNNPMGKGAIMRATFNTEYSNLNVHLDQAAYDEFVRDWPESKRILKGLQDDSRHGPPFVAMQDVEPDEGKRWEMISDCDVNKYWSSLIGVFRGQLRGYVCELMYAQAVMHQHEEDYPDTGVPIVPGWWMAPMEAYAHQVRHHCHACGIPLRGFGSLAIGGEREQVSATHANVFKPKQRGRSVELVQLRSQLGEVALRKSTDYIENGSL